MSIIIIHHGCNNPIYNVHKNVGVQYTQQNTVLCCYTSPRISRLRQPQVAVSALLEG